MSDVHAFSSYLLAQAEKREASERRNYASAALELASIKERLAMIESQYDPLASLMNEKRTERNRLYAAAFFVVVGRMPAAKETT